MLERHEHKHLLACLVNDFLEHGVPLADVELKHLARVGVDGTARDLEQLVHVHGGVDRRDLLAPCLHHHLVLEQVVVLLLLLGQFDLALDVGHLRQIQALVLGVPDGRL